MDLHVRSIPEDWKIAAAKVAGEVDAQGHPQGTTRPSRPSISPTPRADESHVGRTADSLRNQPFRSMMFHQSHIKKSHARWHAHHPSRLRCDSLRLATIRWSKHQV
jgi:hypothetical protein